MTARWRSPEPEDPFNAWVRSHPELDSRKHHIVIFDTDAWVHRYGFTRKGVTYREVQCMMLVERKSHGRDFSCQQHLPRGQRSCRACQWQRDSLLMADQLLRTEKFRTQRINGRFAPGHAQNTVTLKLYSHLLRREVQVKSYGAHLLRISGATPDDSEWIEWDRKEITVEQMVQVLRFDLHPDTLELNDWRRHKETPPAHPMLDGLEAAA